MKPHTGPYTTTFTVYHDAGSLEQAIAHRNAMDKAIEASGGDVRAAATTDGHVLDEAVRHMFFDVRAEDEA